MKAYGKASLMVRCKDYIKAHIQPKQNKWLLYGFDCSPSLLYTYQKNKREIIISLLLILMRLENDYK